MWGKLWRFHVAHHIGRELTFETAKLPLLDPGCVFDHRVAVSHGSGRDSYAAASLIMNERYPAQGGELEQPIRTQRRAPWQDPPC